MRTAEGRVITESLRIIEELDDLFPDSGHRLFSQDASEKEEAMKLMKSFSSVFPSGTRPSSRGSFLYKGTECHAENVFKHIYIQTSTCTEP